jgi:hypothetical protein
MPVWGGMFEGGPEAAGRGPGGPGGHGRAGTATISRRRGVVVAGTKPGPLMLMRPHSIDFCFSSLS